MKLLKNAILASILFGLCGNLYAGQAASKLSSLSDSLIKGYLASPRAADATLAIFRFNCDDKLEKRRVGFAVSELMSHRFVAEGTFKVVERGEMGKLLQEQRLQASGAVDTATAVRLGTLAGAGVVLMGNVQQVDGEYQVNARLVSVETGEVLASGYVELDGQVFETDAYGYINSAARAHPVGIYFLYNYRRNANNLPRSARSSFGATYDYTPHAFSAGIPGIGLRYTPFSRVQVDFSFMTTGRAGVKSTKETVTGSWSRTSEITTEVYAYRGILAYQGSLSHRLKYVAGAGLSKYSLNSDRDSFTTPFLHTRLEYMLQGRIGVSLAANYEFNQKTFLGAGGFYDVPVLRLDRFSVEPSLAIYF
ncbi:MAG: FlgO family outer membrane protein [Elusimicrobiales bacterium]|nr:FlgO family outer membrane protein [Elusimicrobiales bacterium]